MKVAKELGKSAQLLGRWSTKWNWVERVAEWGDEQDREHRIAQTNAIEKMNERHAKLAVALTGQVAQKLNLMSAKDIKT